MTRTLQDVKRDLRRFLGSGGVHGLGVNVAGQAIQIYISANAAVSPDSVIDEMREAARPFGIEVIPQSAPMVMGR